VLKNKEGRAALGKSSGGYGALMLALQRPDVWGGAGALAPDAAFEYCYLPDFPIAWKTLRQHQGSVDTFWSMLRAKDRPSGDDFSTLSTVAMAACYSAAPNGEPELPWDERTGAVRPEVWTRWIEHDPVRVLPKKLEVARGLRALSLECGLRDEYRLYVGAQMLHTQLTDARIEHRFEFFEGSHGAMQHRYPATVAYLAQRLSK
jgi:S-formylglutathione hydrolase FrmB